MDTPLMGMIKIFPYDFIPVGWLQCNGAMLNIQTYSALFALIGIQFGGNGSTTFQLPNLTDASPINNTVFAIAVNGVFPTRD